MHLIPENAAYQHLKNNQDGLCIELLGMVTSSFCLFFGIRMLTRLDFDWVIANKLMLHSAVFGDAFDTSNFRNFISSANVVRA